MSAPTIDPDTLPTTQQLALEVLAARHRLGETLWPFTPRATPALKALAGHGLVDLLAGTVSTGMRARLTDAGRAAVLSPTYESPEPVPAGAPVVDQYARRGVLSYWHDGDTAIGDVDHGRHEWRHNEHWRLRDIYADELNQPLGPAALAYVTEHWPSGTRVIIQTFKAAPDTFTRYTARIWRASDGLEVGPALLRAGLASTTPNKKTR